MKSENHNECNRVRVEDMFCHQHISIKNNGSYKGQPKSKKKKNNRKKREKMKQKKKEAEEKLESIIAQIYHLETNFNKQQAKIYEYIGVFPNEDSFYDFINNVIRNEVETLAEEIHLCTRTISELDRLEDACQPTVVVELRDKIETVIKSSSQIQKIIRMFISKSNDDPNLYNHNLHLSTLKYIYESDKNKELFENACQRQMAKYKDQQYLGLLEQIMEFFSQAKNYEQSDEDSYSDQYSESEEASERVWEQLQALQWQQLAKMKKKKKKKEEDLDFTCPAIINRLQNLTIVDKNRAFCHASQQWTHYIVSKFKGPS